MKCLNCNKDTNNPKFCSRSCAASFNNRMFPKKKTERTCNFPDCKTIVQSWFHTKCSYHKKILMDSVTKNKTIGEYRSRPSVSGKHPSWLHSGVRGLARSWNKHLLNLPCKLCGYSKHVELCHIKPLSSFDDSSLMSEVNGESNIVQLCRNCHWEMDHNAPS